MRELPADRDAANLAGQRRRLGPGELGYVGGQEDMIIDVAIQLAAE